MAGHGSGLDWDIYRVLLAISREGSLVGAAKSLGVSNATVGRQLNRAEDRLNAKLFDRLNNGLFETEAGETAIRFATRIEQSVEIAERQILGLDRSESGVIRLSVPLGVIPFDISRFISEFVHEYPNIRVQILSSDKTSDFMGREVDVVVRAQNDPSSGLWGYKIADVKWSFVATKGFMEEWAPKMQKNPETVALPYIELSPADPSADREQLLTHYPNARPYVECESLDSVIAMVRSGVGTGRIARFMLPHMPELVTLCECDNSRNKLMWLLTHPDFRNTKRIRLFMEFLRDRFMESA